ncbi:energy transducer TonB [Desulfuromonas sp. AOP6]|uniref:energy transducer TonB n=1 Tax=Desulfuromonas sp. AOP6 TaxID=1566351 RepID=UPI0012757F67|nr:energy transducer TonB [Desulfuromonas sp. AOP6]BCA79872.1 hypothetical protein AOP6_1659 [Desulfuromonas sp. AOP6]
MSKMTLIFWGGISLAVHAALLFIPGSDTQVQFRQDHLQVAFQTLPTAVVTHPQPSSEVPRELSKTDPLPKPFEKQQDPKPATLPSPPKEIPQQPVYQPTEKKAEFLSSHEVSIAEPADEPARSKPSTTETTPQNPRPLPEKTSAESASAPANALVEAAPLYADNPPPNYPRLARERGWQGEVVLRARVSRNGRVIHVRIEESSGYTLLDRAAVKAVKGWRFRPARQGRHPIEAEVRLPVRFTLQSS